MNRFKKGILFATLFIGLVAVGCSNDDDDDLIGNWIKNHLLMVLPDPAQLVLSLALMLILPPDILVTNI